MLSARHYLDAHDAVERLVYAVPDLSPAELRVCLHLLESRSTKEIASQLSLSSRTVENHRLSIRRKLGRPANLTTALIQATAPRRIIEAYRSNGPDSSNHRERPD